MHAGMQISAFLNRKNRRTEPERCSSVSRISKAQSAEKFEGIMDGYSLKIRDQAEKYLRYHKRQRRDYEKIQLQNNREYQWQCHESGVPRYSAGGHGRPRNQITGCIFPEEDIQALSDERANRGDEGRLGDSGGCGD